MKYTQGEIQRLIDDLDYAQAFFPAPDDISIDDDQYKATMKQLRTSLLNASDLLCDLPTEVIESLDKHRDVFVKGAM